MQWRCGLGRRMRQEEVSKWQAADAEQCWCAAIWTKGLFAYLKHIAEMRFQRSHRKLSPFARQCVCVFRLTEGEKKAKKKPQSIKVSEMRNTPRLTYCVL